MEHELQIKQFSFFCMFFKDCLTSVQGCTILFYYFYVIIVLLTVHFHSSVYKTVLKKNTCDDFFIDLQV